jgi:hypothetical protein
MTDIKEFTPTELLHEINIVKVSHDNLKDNVIDLTHIIDDTTALINEKLDYIRELEKKYIELIEELDNRKLIE